jgi:hypothetical protein
MKHLYLKSSFTRLSIVLVLLGAVLIIHSCKKDNAGKESAIVTGTITNPDISLAQKWYEVTYANAASTKQVTQGIGQDLKDLSKRFIPSGQKQVSLRKMA